MARGSNRNVLRAAAHVVSWLMGLALTSHVHAQCYEEQKLTSSGGTNAGESVSISGNMAVMGGDEYNSGGTGSAYAYRFNGDTWGEEQKLVASDGSPFDRFGKSLSISGDFIVVGAPEDDDAGARSGSAYVYRFNGESWEQAQKLLDSRGSADDHFGWTVSISGDVIVVGIPGYMGFEGSAYVYRFNGATWEEEQRLRASDGRDDDQFGFVAVSGDVIVVGSGDHHFTGAAYVYRFNGAAWEEEQKLVTPDGEPYDNFLIVAVDGDVIVVGAPADDDACPQDPNCDSGSAHVYRFNGSTWVEEQKLLASDGAAGEYFGWGVSVLDDVAVIGAPFNDGGGYMCGSAYVYRFDGNVWAEEMKLLPSDSGSNGLLGMSTAQSGETTLVGAPRNGNAYVFLVEECARTRHVPDEYPTIQAAIDASNGGNLILVEPGTYFETIDFDGKDVEVVADTGAAAGGAVIDGGEAGSVVTFNNGEGPDAILDGFTLTGGATTGEGGGIFIDGASPTIRNCEIVSNTATSGGGVWVDSGSPVFVRCDFVWNTGEVGGALNFISSSPELVNCRILGNVATNRGGALAQSFSEPLFMNCLLVGNSAALGAGAVSNYEGHPVFINSTLSANNAPSVGGIRNQGPLSGVTLANTVMWGNFDDTGTGEGAQIGLIQGALPANVLIDYGCVQGWTGQYGGTGNVAGDPMFRFEAHPGPDETWGTADDNYGNLRLSAGSSAIDAADNTAVPPDVHDLDGDDDRAEQVPVDLDETARFFDDPGTPDTGNGTAPIVDMGPYEYEELTAETICPGDSDDYLRQFGGSVTGDALDLCASDNVYLDVRQTARLSPLLPFIRLEYWAHTTLADASITSIDYTIEGRVTAFVSGGQNPDTLRTSIRNYAGGFELIDQRGTSAGADEVITHTQTTNAPDYVNAGDGEVRVRQDVFDPGNVFSPNWFLKVDVYEVTVMQ